MTQPADAPATNPESSPAAHAPRGLTGFVRRRGPWIVAAAALLVRLVYFATVPQPPVQFDARRYTGAALALLLALENPTLLTDSRAREQIDFQLLYLDRIHDEKVVWLPAYPPTFPGSLDDVYFAGPIYPLFIGTVIDLAPRYDFWVIRILQALFDSLTAALLWILTCRLVSLAAAWWAGGLWVFYGPAIYKCGELLTETISITLILLVVLTLVRAIDDPKRRRYLVLAGALIAILAMTKASASALILPLLAAWIWTKRKTPRHAFGGAAWIATSAAVTIAPWLLLVWIRFGTLAARDPEYAGANLRSSSILKSEGYDLDVMPADFWTYPVWRDIKDRPVAYARLYMRKLYRLWSRPCDDYRRAFPFGLTGVLWMHRFIILLALVGLLTWAARAGPYAVIPIAIVIYYSLLHMVMHVVSRYNLLAMPFMISAATMGSAWLFHSPSARRAGRILTVVAAFLGAIAVIRFLRPAFWLSLDSLFQWRGATYAFWISGGLAIVAAAWFLTRGRRGASAVRVRWGASLVLLVIFLTQAIPREGYADWSVDLDRPGRVARRIVTFPEWLCRDSIVAAFIDVDAVVEHGKNCEVTLRIDGHAVTREAGDLIRKGFFYPKLSYTAFMEMYGDRRCDVRQWMVTQLDSSLIDSMLVDHRLRIELSARPATPDPGGLILYGDLPVPDYHKWIAPHPELSSVERYFDEAGDPRIWGREPLDFVTSKSEFIDDGKVRTDDLSNRWGRQVGQYRMVVTIVKPDGRYQKF